MVRNCFFILTLIILSVICSEAVSMQNAVATTIVDEWVYTEMETLFRRGLISNYPCEWVSYGNKLTRFEIAYYIKNLITSELDSFEGQNKMNAIPQSVIEAIRKLVAEFRNELTAMGVKITDIDMISPNLNETRVKTDDYQDLDIILSKGNEIKKNQESFYYFGQYIKEIYRKSFLFLPDIFVEESNRALLQGSAGIVNIVYHPNQEENPPFLVVKGDLPIDAQKTINGYYLFPLDNISKDKTEKYAISDLDVSVLDLLDEVNHVRQVENLWRFSGPLSLKGYSKFETDLQSKLVFGEFNKNLKIGGYLVTTDAKPDVTNMGLPFFSSRQSMAMDLDTISRSDLQSLQISIQGNMALNSKTSITGELGLLYRGDKSGREGIIPSDAKAGAGIQYQFNDYWAVLSYQSFVNSQLESDLLSTTSVGVEYNNWVTLWLAYQILSFEDSKLTGALTFRF